MYVFNFLSILRVLLSNPQDNLGANMIKNLIKAAAELDAAGFHVEADLMDKIMQKVAEEVEEEEVESEPESEEEMDFGFMNQEDEEEEESEEDMEDGEHSVEECLQYCSSFSHEEKVELIKALLDSMDH
jgi:hypothetical protein